MRNIQTIARTASLALALCLSTSGTFAADTAATAATPSAAPAVDAASAPAHSATAGKSLYERIDEAVAALRKYKADQAAGHPWPEKKSAPFLEEKFQLLRSASLSKESKGASDEFCDHFFPLAHAFMLADDTDSGMDVFSDYYDHNKKKLEDYGGRKTGISSDIKQYLLSRARKFGTATDGAASVEPAAPKKSAAAAKSAEPPRKPSAYYPSSSGGTGTAGADGQH